MNPQKRFNKTISPTTNKVVQLEQALIAGRQAFLQQSALLYAVAVKCQELQPSWNDSIPVASLQEINDIGKYQPEYTVSLEPDYIVTIHIKETINEAKLRQPTK